MNEWSDQQLLREYAERRSEAAFAELVRRHVNLIYSAAHRMVCDPHLAEDVAQGAFVALARNAPKLTERAVLSGWLHRTAQNIAAQAVRTDARRRVREQEAAAMNELLSAETDADWKHIAPHLDTALGELGEADRDALLLRYFERKSAKEMAQVLGVSEEAAQRRVSRAVERLREFFAKRGIAVGASGLGFVISANAVQAAPVGLAATISTAAAVTVTTVATTTATATKVIAMTTLQKIAVTATLAVVTGAGIYEANQASHWRKQNEALRQQQAPFLEQIQQLTRDRDDAAQQVAWLRDENERLNRNTGEILRLRGEVTMLRQSQNAVGKPANPINPPVPVPVGPDPALVAAVEQGRALGLAVVRGEPGALEKLAEVAKAAVKSFNTDRVGMDDTQRSELSRKTFASIQVAFEVIGEAAAEGNRVAIAAVERALQVQELKGHAVKIVGTLAGNGNEVALEMLVNPDKYGILLSSSVFALRSAAEAGNPKAIDALVAVSKDPRRQALWHEVANALSTPAQSGNAVAVDGLISMSVATNKMVRDAVILGLRKASANQSAKAAETLRSMGIQ